MAFFSQQAFNQFILDNGVIGFKPEGIKLKSGRTSHYYANWRTVAEDVFLFNQLTDFVVAYLRDHGFNPISVYGVPEGATKLGLFVQDKWAKQSPHYGKGSHPLPMGRAKPKEHGDPKDKFFVGMPRGETVVVEDVTTTGGSLTASIDTLRECNIHILAAIGLTNRMEKDDNGRSVEEAIRAKGVAYYAMSNALELLSLVYAKQRPGQDVARKVEEEFKQFGVKPLRLL